MSAPTPPDAVVREFYRAVAAGDADAVRVLVEARFAENSTLTWPASLPYGGTVAGRERLAEVLSRSAASAAKVGAQDLRLVDVVDGGDRLVAEVEFSYFPPGGGAARPGSALEAWTFVDGLVTTVRAFYWDTAALVS